MDVDTHNSQSLETYPVMLEQKSLRELILAPLKRRSDVRTMIICTDHVSRDGQDDDSITDTHDYSNGDSDTKHFDAERDDVATVASPDPGAYWSCLLDQERFTSGLDLAYLTDAMKQLPNCKKIHISDTCTTSGAVMLKDRIGTRLCKGFDPYSRYSKHFVMRVLRTTLLAISGSGIKVVELDICLGLANEGGQHSITDDVFHLPDEYRLLLRHGFTNIKKLRLVVNTQNDEDWDENVSEFIKLFPNLSLLWLRVANHDTSVEFSCLTEALQALPLEVFELVNCSTTQENLMPLLLHNQTTLKEIVLNKVNIERGTNGTWNWVKNHLRTELPRCSLDFRDCRVAGKVPTLPMASWHEF
ncbi:hypothetical protein VFPPC_11388 [Pochonia chlamydosporia 170]|uniref:Uncharacterized protein n=1 Tax=Pochonia chlamydosporia 170 TaxID=1380566 RepID=A0A179EY03_METCM|nr:hypothetical protein VFPPC_11388 [Pochonia chlamydosporia 170]OAQ58075.1 hypothetical protein VFPPC_11388 [Pochonia chlamydosporia 170]